MPEKTELDQIADESRMETMLQHEMSFWVCIRKYPVAVFWSLFFSLAVIAAGYDGQIIASFYGLPAFQNAYGYDFEGQNIISAPFQTALGMGNPIGQVLGALFCGYPIERWGRKWPLAACCVWSIAWIFLQFFAPNLQGLTAAEVIGGLVFGAFAVISPTYSSELAPIAIRGQVLAFTNQAFVLGQFVAQGTAAGVEQRLDDWAYRIPFALQWIWPAVLLSGMYFAPESPWWLVRKGKTEKAEKALLQLGGKANAHHVKQTLAMIEKTDMLEQELEAHSSYWDCFKGENLRRTEISCMVYSIQVLCGNPLIGNFSYFFELAGIAPSVAFDLGVGSTAIGFVGTFLSWFLLIWYGRRPIYNWGLYLDTLLLFIIAFLDLAPSYDDNPAFSFAQASLMLVWIGVYQTTVGPVCFSIIGEVSSTKLRSKTIALATAAQAIFAIVFQVAVPFMINPDQADLRGKVGFIFGGISLVCCVWCHLRLPESKDRSFEELDIMFARKMPARKFKQYQFTDQDYEIHRAAQRSVGGPIA